MPKKARSAVALFCALLCALTLSSCSVAEKAETVLAGLLELVFPRIGFVDESPSDYNDIDDMPYSASPHYLPTVSTQAFDSLLTEGEKRLYSELLKKAYRVSPEFDTETESDGDPYCRCEQAIIRGAVLSDAQILKTVRALYFDHPEIFWISEEFNFICDPNRNYTAVRLLSVYSAKDIAEWLPQLQDAVSSFIVSVPGGLSDYELEKLTHDFIINNCEYEDTDAKILRFYHCIYGALVKQQAVCEGYSRAMQLLLNLLGIDCVSIVGDAVDVEVKKDDDEIIELHMWNAVKLDEEWYYVDSTWNDNGKDAMRYCYLNLNSDIFGISHSPAKLANELTDEQITGDDTYCGLNINFFVPDCNGMYYNYYVYELPHLTDYAGADVKEGLYAAAAERREYFAFYVDPAFMTAQTAYYVMFENYPQYFFGYVDEINPRLFNYKINNRSHLCYYDNNLSFITVYLTYS